MESVFIDDGQTRTFRVAAVPGLHGGVSGRFRPALPEERYEFARSPDSDGRTYCQRAAQLLDRHILDWDALDRRGQPMPKSADQLARLHPNVFGRVLDQVLGYTAADAARDAKNSPAG